MKNEKILSNEELLEITAGASSIKKGPFIRRPLVAYGMPPIKSPVSPVYAVGPDIQTC